jgi:PAS domain S-box-containing protein
MKTQSVIINRLIQILNGLNTLIEDYPVYVYVINRDMQLVWFNRYIEEHFPAVKEHPDWPCFKVLWGFENPCEDCPTFEQVESSRTQRDTVKRRLPGSDKDVYLEIISLSIRDENEQVAGILKIGMDVTSSEEAQQSLREKEKLFTSIIDTSADAIFFLDNDDRILSWNKGAEDIFGYTTEEITGKSTILLIPKELIELGELYYIKQVLDKKGFIRKYETQRLDKYGRIIYVDLTRTVIRNEKNEPIGSSVMIKDITSRKELEFELRRTILELSKLNELNEILYTTYRLDDILRMILIAITAGEGLRFNRAFLFLMDEQEQNLYGHLAIGPANEAEAHRIWSALQDHFRSLKEIVKQFEINLQGSDHQINEIVQRVSIPVENKENVLIMTLENRRVYYVRHGKISDTVKYNFDVKDSNLFEILGTDTFVVVPLVTKQESMGVIVADNQITKKDITEEEIESLKLFANQASMAIENARLYKNLEDRIQELQEAYRKLEENANRLVKAERLATIGEMSAKVAHEIRNPLVSIGGFARLMEKKLPENSELKNYTSIVSSQVSNLESILNNILVIANPKTPKRSKVDIHQVLQQVLQMMEDIFQNRQVKIDLQFNCRQSLVWGDEKLLFQVFLNLVKNSLEAMHSRQEITLETICDNDYIQIVVRDTGEGISGDVLERIYEPFFTTKTEGTGLGLAIVRQIINDHDGKMEVNSIPGEGTTTKIFLPRCFETEAAEKDKQPT